MLSTKKLESEPIENSITNMKLTISISGTTTNIVATTTLGLVMILIVYSGYRYCFKNNQNNNNLNNHKQHTNGTRKTERKIQKKDTQVQNENENENEINKYFTIKTEETTKQKIQIDPKLPPIIIETKTTKHIEVPKTIAISNNWCKFTDGLTFGVSEMKGDRLRMENSTSNNNSLSTYTFSVFDGHLGKECAQFCTDTLHKNMIGEKSENNDVIECIRSAFHKTEKDWHSKAIDTQSEAGAVGVFVYYDSQLKVMYVANVGDCRAVLCTHGNCKVLTEEHAIDKSESETCRVASLIIGEPGDRRLCGELSVTRAFGDYHQMKKGNMNNNKCKTSGDSDYKCAKLEGLLCDPHIVKHEMEKDDEFLIVACDGLWDVVKPENAMKTCRRSLRRNGNCKLAAKKLVDLAKGRSTTDNVSVMVIAFANKNAEGKLQIGPPLEILSLPKGYRRRKFKMKN